jgi:hypothetical protein
MFQRVGMVGIAFLISGCVNAPPHTKGGVGSSPKPDRPFPAAEWVFVGELMQERQQAFVDVSSIRIMGAVRRAWIKWTFPIDPAHKAQERILYGTAFNCTNETNRDEAEIIVYNDGTHYSEGTYGEGIEWVIPADISTKPWLPLPAGTPWHAAMIFVCHWREDKQADINAAATVLTHPKKRSPRA